MVLEMLLVLYHGGMGQSWALHVQSVSGHNTMVNSIPLMFEKPTLPEAAAETPNESLHQATLRDVRS